MMREWNSTNLGSHLSGRFLKRALLANSVLKMPTILFEVTLDMFTDESPRCFASVSSSTSSISLLTGKTCLVENGDTSDIVQLEDRLFETIDGTADCRTLLYEYEPISPGGGTFNDPILVARCLSSEILVHILIASSDDRQTKR